MYGLERFVPQPVWKGGGSSGSQTVTQKSSVELSPEQKELYELAKPQILDFANTPLELFPGSGVAGINPTQLLAQQQALQAGGGVISNLASSGAGASQFLTGGDALFAGSNPALQSYIDAAVQPLFQQLTESALPAIRSGAQVAGQLGGSRQGIAEGLGIGRTAQAAGQTTANIANQGYQTGLEAMVRALGLLPQTQQAQLLPAQITEAVGAQERAFEQELLNDEIRRFTLEQTLPFMQAQQVAGLAFGLPGGTANTSVTSPPVQSPSPFTAGLGGAAAGASIGSVIPVPGAPVIGAGIGALIGLLG